MRRKRTLNTEDVRVQVRPAQLSHRKRTVDAEAADTSALAPANPVTGESSQEIWRRWSLERAEHDRQERVREKAAANAESEEGVYAVEIARYVAEHHAQGVCPEWRYLRDLIGKPFTRILRQQPEMRQRDVQSRERIIAGLFEALPLHYRPALAELRTVMELIATARESTTFLLGFELGRQAGRQQTLRDPRVMLAPMADRKLLAPARQRTRTALRLTDGEVK